MADSLKDFWAELDNQPRRTKVWWAVRRHIISVLRSPRTLRRKVKHFVQRGRRGWSDEDVWSFDHFLSGVIAGGVRQLRKNAHGHPASVCTTCGPGGLDHGVGCDGMAEWNKVLDQIADGFELHAKDSYSTGYLPNEDEQARMDLAFDLLKAYYGALWD